MFKRTLFFVAAFAVVAAGALAGAGGAQAQKQPEMVTLKADFVPGNKTLFYDDFTDMTADDPPLHFKSRGAAPELRAAGEVRQLTITQKNSLTPNLKGLPPNFTYEAEVKYDIARGWGATNLLLMNKEKEALTLIVRAVEGHFLDLVLSTKVPKYEEFGRKRVKVDFANAVKLALWVQDGRVRAFVDGEKQLDFNQVEIAPIDRIEMQSEGVGGAAVGYRSVRFAESSPDFSKVLGASGRYVTHAILFDTGSDRLKVESAAAIQTVAKGLQADSALKLLIEGHTDSVGDAAKNLDLSKRRAEAVKSVLVSQFGIDAARLSTAGLGATKPIGPNDTPQGRAENRRVEFVKQ